MDPLTHPYIHPAFLDPKTRNGVLCAHRQSIHPPAWPISNANIHIRASHIEGEENQGISWQEENQGSSVPHHDKAEK